MHKTGGSCPNAGKDKIYPTKVVIDLVLAATFKWRQQVPLTIQEGDIPEPVPVPGSYPVPEGQDLVEPSGEPGSAAIPVVGEDPTLQNPDLDQPLFDQPLLQEPILPIPPEHLGEGISGEGFEATGAEALLLQMTQGTLMEVRGDQAVKVEPGIGSTSLGLTGEEDIPIEIDLED